MAEPIIDLHQHTQYKGRTDEQLRAHQRTMGATKTVLLPAGSRDGLAVGAGGNDTVVALAKRFPNEFVFFANEVPDLPEAPRVLEKYLQEGAVGIGEQKFPVACDSPYIDKLAEIAHFYGVPILMHFQHETYNLGFERFPAMVKRHPQSVFIGHAQTWWGNIDARHEQKVLYPKGKVTPGGLTDRLLADYPNVYGDLSAGSGLNALLRDEEHARGFLLRHQDKLIYGSDCDDKAGEGPGCSGSRCLAALRRLCPDEKARRKILYGNAARLFRIT